MTEIPSIQVEWKPVSLSIEELWSLARGRRLILRPDFQRRAVWSENAQRGLIDTILRNLPMPKVFFATELLGYDDLLRRVIDGQQRLTAIFHFLENRYRVNVDGSALEQYFDELPDELKRRILGYHIDGNDIFCEDEDVIRKIYSRVNKYNIALNRQELRKADFPGDFLTEAEELADLTFFEDNKVFTAMQRRRMLDVEFASELLVVVLDGVQDKKDALDKYCQKYQIWDSQSRKRAHANFVSTLKDIDNIFSSCGLKLATTRFRQKSDFYSLFTAVFELECDKIAHSDLTWDPIASDLKILDDYIAPESPVDLLSSYAVKCVSDANSSSSRRWRAALLKSFLRPTVCGLTPEAEDVARFSQIRLQLPIGTLTDHGESHISDHEEPAGIDLFNFTNGGGFWVGWHQGVFPMQMSNMVFVSDTRFSGNEHKYQNCFDLGEIAANYFVNHDA